MAAPAPASSPSTSRRSIRTGLAGLGCATTSIGVGVYGRRYPGRYYGRGTGYGDRVIVVPPGCPGGDFGGGDFDGGFDGGFDAGGFDF